MPDKETLPKKSKREIKKEAFKQDVTKTIDREVSNLSGEQPSSVQAAKKASSDFDFKIPHPENWETMSPDQKNKWNETNKDAIIADNFANKITQLEGTFKPSQEKVPELDKEKLKELETKSRKRRWVDKIYGVAQGMQGKSVDRSKLPTQRYKDEKAQMYGDYKSAVEKNRATSDAWEQKRYKDRMDWLKSSYDRTQNPDEKRMWQKEMDNEDANRALRERELNQRAGARKASTKAKPIYTHKLQDKSWQMTNQGDPYSDLYFKIAGSSPTILNEFAKLSGYPTDDEGNLKALSASNQERLANTLLSNAFEMRVDEDGNQVAVPLPGKENFLQDISTAVSEANQHRQNIKDLENEMEEKIDGAGVWTREAPIREEYEALIADVKRKLEQTQTQLSSIIGGETNSGRSNQQESTAQQNNQATQNVEKTGFMDIVNKYK